MPPSLARLGQRELPAHQGPRVSQGRKAKLVLMEFLVPRVRLGLRGLQGPQERLAVMVRLVLMVKTASTECQGSRGHKG